MKKNTISTLSFLLFWSLSLFAQQSTVSISIYFDAGKHQLNEKVISSLKQFIQDIQKLSDYELNLKAFTDDVGSLKYNQKLSEDRAKEVEDYLAKSGIIPNKKIVEGLGEISLSGEMDTEKEREQNRRVEISVSHFAPQTLNELLGYLDTGGEQVFFHNNESEITVFGDKGSIIDIPAMAFQTADGREVLDVKITLKEAYSFGDMVSHNLSTVSDGKLIETGGMIFIAAVDAKTGEQLQLKDKKEIDIAMPSQKELPSDMQLFAGDNRKSVGEKMNWKPVNKKFTSSKSSYRQYLPDYSKIKPGTKFHIDSMQSVSADKRISYPDLPKYMSEPQIPVVPALPRFSKLEAPDSAKLVQKSKRQRGESKKEYATRMASLLIQSKKSYEAALTANQKKRETYTKDSLTYIEKTALYKVEKEKYDAYQAEIKNIAAFFINDSDSIEKDPYFIHAKSTMKGSIISPYKFPEYLSEVMRYRKLLKKECKKLGLTESFKTLSEHDFSYLDSIKVQLKRYEKFFSPLRINDQALAFNTHKGSTNTLNSNLWSTIDSLKKTSKFEHIDRLLRIVYEKTDNFYNEIPTLNKNIDLSKEASKICNINDIMVIFERLKKESDEWQQNILEEKKAKGILSDNDIENYFTNSIKSANLGWINCDRFLNNKGEKVELLVNAEANENTTFYVIFKDMKSVLPLSAGNVGYSAFMYDGVPKGMSVKLLGLRVKDGKTETFVYEGKTEDINTLKVNFTTTKIKDLKALLSEV